MRRPHAVPAVIAAVMLLVAMGSCPYVYYTVLRWVVCVAAVFAAVVAARYKKPWIACPFGAVAVTFNPLFPLSLGREVWCVVDIVTAAAFIAAIAVLRSPERDASATDETDY